ncbi:MAG: hypothetical protein ABGY24_15435, partial [bacterium]
MTKTNLELPDPRTHILQLPGHGEGDAASAGHKNACIVRIDGRMGGNVSSSMAVEKFRRVNCLPAHRDICGLERLHGDTCALHCVCMI